jgi:uncharacterized membrane protein
MLRRGGARKQGIRSDNGNQNTILTRNVQKGDSMSQSAGARPGGHRRPSASIRPGLGDILLALIMIGLGIRGLVYGDFAGVWQQPPIEVPAANRLALAVALVELVAGLGLLVRRTATMASIALVVFLLLWAVLLKLPAVVAVPGMEATWLGLAEITVILAGAWTLMALRLAGATRPAQWLLALSLMPIGLAHFFYAPQTTALMPSWLPWHLGWAWFTGAASLLAAVAVLLGIWPRLAVVLEASMLSVITLVIWLPGVIATPGNATWTPFLMSSAIALGAWAAAEGYRRAPWLDRPRRWRDQVQTGLSQGSLQAPRG